MPHGFLKDFKSNLSEYAVIILGQAQTLALQQVQKVVLEVLEKLKEACPPPEELAKLSLKVNNVRKIVNGIQGKISKIQKLPQTLQPIIIGAKIIVDLLSHLPVPGTIGTPPGPAGGVIYSEPQGMAASRAAKLSKFQKFVETLEEDVNGINLLLSVVQGVFIPILSALDLIDGLIAQCASNQIVTDEERLQLIKDIQGATQTAATEGVLYTSKNLNNLPYPNITENQRFKPGFSNLGTDTTDTGISTAFGLNSEEKPTGNTYLIKVINDPTSPDIAPRRQAIVQDFRGVIVLRGPVSFASRPDILIEEMKFLIDNRLP